MLCSQSWERHLPVLPRYSYTAIPEDRFRVFQLSQVTGSLQIEGSFIFRPLGLGSEYEAVSYTWGRSHEKCDIVVDGEKRLTIPDRVANILRDLRLPNSPRLLWIDAICIDQVNTVERSQQVRIMRQIYANAAAVRIWLDLDIGEDNPGLHALTNYCGETTLASLDSGDLNWYAVDSILNEEYWRRMWVQQEMSSATRISIQCRHVEIPTTGLLHYYRLRYEQYSSGDIQNPEKFTIEMSPPFTQALSYWKARRASNLANNVFRGGHQYSSIYNALERCWAFESSDPRDKLFALDGAIETWTTPAMVINYELPVFQVYLQVAKHMIETWSSLAFLCDCSLGHSDPENGLPSWLPDYSISKPSTFPFATVDERLPTEYVFFRKPVFSKTDAVLSVQGFVIDKVLIPYGHLSYKRVLHEFLAQEVFEDFRSLALTALELRKSAGVLEMTPRNLPIDEDPALFEQQAAIFSLISASDMSEGYEHRLNGFKAQRWLFGLLKKLNKTLEMNYSSLLRQDNFAFSGRPATVEFDITNRMRGRSLYISKRGELGLAPRATIPGDEIWQIFGCQWPLVLRRQQGAYIVVGPAYHLPFTDRPDLIYEGLKGFPASGVKDGFPWSNRFGKFKIETIKLI